MPTSGTLLRDYEVGRCISAIEWVARGEKPIAEIAARSLSSAELKRLTKELEGIIETALEPVRGYILPLADSGMYAFGFYSAPWAIEARLFLELYDCPDWLQGLVFGYSPHSIQKFIESDGRVANARPCDGEGKVEMFHPCSVRSHSRNQESGKFRTRGLYAQ